MIKVGSVVKHDLFAGPGTVVAIHDDGGGTVVEVFWQSMNRNGFHSLSGLKLITGED